MNTNLVIMTYVAYLVVSIAMTIWVGRTLFTNGHLFLIDAFHGDEARAAAVNRLLLVGFYLINFGFVLLFLRAGERPMNAIGALEYVATKIGIVLLVLGGMHFFNMFNFDKMRRKARKAETVKTAA